MTPEQIRRILDPGQRRAGFDAWRTEQRGQTVTTAPHDAGSSPVRLAVEMQRGDAEAELRDGVAAITRKTMRKDVELLECLRGSSAEKTAREVAASRGGRVVFVKALRKDGGG